MRLLNIFDLTFQEFYETSRPPYYILSHFWCEEEVNYKDVLKRRAKGAGWRKIESFCDLVRRGKSRLDEDRWVWVDTCCIDQKSSAELSEAINSMWNWYENAQVCHVYLADVTKADKDGFAKSKWFTRGWTLQELLAPKTVIFHDKNWEEIGSKGGLAEEIKGITGAMPDYSRLHTRVSVAERMHWASNRVTSRSEDIAYCLLGLFNVNMPLLYGEGAKKAFFRLQLEILKASSDDSILAWEEEVEPSLSLLAPLPASFKNSGRLISHRTRSSTSVMWMTTGRGMEVHLPGGRWALREDDGCKFINVILGSQKVGDGETFQIVIRLFQNDPTSKWYRLPSFDIMHHGQVGAMFLNQRQPNKIWMALPEVMWI